MEPALSNAGASMVKVVKSATVQGDGSYDSPEYVDMAGGQKLDFSNVFKQFKNKKAGTVIITVAPITSGTPIQVTAQVK